MGFKSLKALENLDNTAVLTARGQVLTPSLQFYWEGPPQDMLGQLVRQAIECQSTKFTPVDYQPRVEHDGVLTGRVTAFNVEETEGGRFVVALHLDLWTKNSGSKVATGDFSAYAPLENFEAETVAKGASEAVGRIMGGFKVAAVVATVAGVAGVSFGAGLGGGAGLSAKAVFFGLLSGMKASPVRWSWV